MKGPGQENDFAKRAKEMNTSLPSQMDNKDYGKKRKAVAHKYSVKDSKTGKLYWAPAVMEKTTLVDFLINEGKEDQLTDKLTKLPDIVVNELKKLISKGAKDTDQNWSDAAELTNTAYHVAKIRRPIPDQKGAWNQYIDLLKHAVRQLRITRGDKGTWRVTPIVYSESYQPQISDVLEEAESRFFVKIPGAMDVEIEASDMTEVIRELTNKIRRHGGSHVEVRHRTQEGAILVVWKHDQEVEEIIIQAVS